MLGRCARQLAADLGGFGTPLLVRACAWASLRHSQVLWTYSEFLTPPASVFQTWPCNTTPIPPRTAIRYPYSDSKHGGRALAMNLISKLTSKLPSVNCAMFFSFVLDLSARRPYSSVHCIGDMDVRIEHHECMSALIMR